MRFSTVLSSLFVLGLATSIVLNLAEAANNPWTSKELQTLQTLSIKQLPAMPNNSSNRYAQNLEAMKLGQQFFYDPRFSGGEDTSCSTCHKPELQFVDNQARAEATGIGTRKTMSVVGAAYSQWLFWDGRADSLWAQALGPLENPLEHAGTRTQFAWVIKHNYKAAFEKVFGTLPSEGFWSNLPKRAGPAGNTLERENWAKLSYVQKDTISRMYSNIGKAIAAFETNLKPGGTRLDQYVQEFTQKGSSKALTTSEVAGLKLFIGKANCVKCHGGPRLTDDSFHNIAVPTPKELEADEGRQRAVLTIIQNEFGCFGLYSDDTSNCSAVTGNQNAALAPEGAFKTPSLRDVVGHFPYMHSGQYPKLEDVIKHYNTAPKAIVGISELKELKLSLLAQQDLLAFLKVLNAPVDAAPEWLATPNLP